MVDQDHVRWQSCLVGHKEQRHDDLSLERKTVHEGEERSGSV